MSEYSWNLNPPGGLTWALRNVDKDGEIDYYDTYGLEPYEPNIVGWLKRRGGEVRVNNRMLQIYMSTACGQHCIYFLILRCGGFPMNTTTNTLSDSPFINDSFVTAYVNKNEFQFPAQFKFPPVSIGSCCQSRIAHPSTLRNQLCLWVKISFAQ